MGHINRVQLFDVATPGDTWGVQVVRYPNFFLGNGSG